MKPSALSSFFHPARLAAGAVILAGISLLAGCPSQSHQQASAPRPPVAQAAAFHGTAFGGRQPIVGATVVAYAAGTTVGATPTQIGTAVTDANGSFTMTFNPTPATGQVIYATATGGNAGGGTNSAIGLMTVAGIQGSTLAPVPDTVNIDELTTVAATAALKNYISFVDCSTITDNSQTGTCVSIPGALDLNNMAATLNNLANVITGQPSAFLAANSTTAGAPLTATLEKLDTLASVLANCVNSAGPTAGACTSLFQATGGHPNTLMSAWLIARMPATDAKALALYALKPGSPVYPPTLAAKPATTVEGFWTVGGARYAFTTNNGANTVSGFRLGVASGALAAISGASVPAGNTPTSAAVDPTGRYAYVANTIGGTISEYTIGANGALISNGTVAAGIYPSSVTVDPSGRYVYVANGGDNDVSVYTIGTDGALTSTGAAAAGTNPGSVAVDPSGRYVYTANYNSNNVSAYAIGTNGALTSIGTVAAGAGPTSLAVDPSGRYVYTANYSGNNVSAYAIGTNGALTSIGTVAAGAGPTSLAVDPSGRYVYTANYSGHNVSEYAIGANGALTSIGTVTVGERLFAVAVDPSGRYVYVANYYGGTVVAYAIGADGTLTSIGTMNSHAPGAFAADPTGRFLYVVDRYDWTVSAFTIGSPGSLTPTGTTLLLNHPIQAAMGPTGRCVYVTVTGTLFDPTITTFTIASDGTLAFLDLLPTSSTPGRFVVDPSGRFLYVVNSISDDSISEYSIANDCSLTPIGSATGDDPLAIAVDARGPFVYVTNLLNKIVEYEIAGDGSLTPIGLISTGDGNGTAIAVDPSGRYVYAATDATVVAAYKIASDGTLTPNGTASAGSDSDSVAVDPSGHYVYVVNAGDNSLSAFVIANDGALVANGTLATGANPRTVVVDPTGHFVYVVNANDDNVGAFRIEGGGTLSTLTDSPFPTGVDPTGIVVGP